MRRSISNREIEKQLRKNLRPDVIDAGATSLPLSDLSDREFELLVYHLLKQEILEGEHSEYTDVALMSGVAERGRDCVLYKNGCVVGLVQCKKYKKRVNRPAVIKEVLKFIMFSILDPSLMPNHEAFKYLLYVSEDYTEPAKNLIHSFSKEICEEITSSKIDKYIVELMGRYESFSSFLQKPPTPKITDILKNICFHAYNGDDLIYRINKKPDILRLFFNVQMVSSLEETESVIRRTMEEKFKEYGLKSIGDSDIKTFQKRIEDIPESKRLNLGIADIFGYPASFIKGIKDKLFHEFLDPVIELRINLTKYFIKFINDEIQVSCKEKVTRNLVRSYKIHPFSAQLAIPYLQRKNLKKVLRAFLPHNIYTESNPDSLKSDDEIINEINDHLLSVAENVVKDDFSDFSIPPELFEFKVGLAKHVHSGFTTIEQIKSQFEKDILVLKPVLDEIDVHIDSLMLENPTIVLKDGAFLSEREELDRVKQSITSLNDAS